MKKRISTILILGIFFFQNSYSQISLGSQTSTSIKVDQDINFTDGAATNTITLSGVNIETTGTVTFSNAKVFLIDSKIKCNKIIFTNATDLSISKAVDISSHFIIFPSKSIALSGSGSGAELLLSYKSPFQSLNCAIQPSPDFSIVIKKVL